ncbi:Carotenoid cleavage dioxygenase 7, chloroplastic [Glycine soja]
MLSPQDLQKKRRAYGGRLKKDMSGTETFFYEESLPVPSLSAAKENKATTKLRKKKEDNGVFDNRFKLHNRREALRLAHKNDVQDFGIEESLSEFALPMGFDCTGGRYQQRTQKENSETDAGLVGHIYLDEATHCKVDSRRNRLLTVSCNAEDMLLPRSNFTFSGSMAAVYGMSPMILSLMVNPSKSTSPIYLIPRFPGKNNGKERDWRVPVEAPSQLWLLHVGNAFEVRHPHRNLDIQIQAAACSYQWFNFSKLFDPILYSGNLLGAFDVLSKRLRLIEDLPLKVSSVQPLDSGLKSAHLFSELEILNKEGASSSVQAQDITTPMNYYNQYPLMQKNNLPLTPELGQVNENNTSNQLLVSNMLANQNFNEINAQSCSYPPFFQQNTVNAEALSGTTNGHFTTNQTSPLFALSNHGIIPPSAWNSPR